MARNVSITRVNGAGDQSSNGTFTAGVFTPNADNAVADIDRIETDLNAGTNVAVNTSGGAGVQQGDITIAASQTITKTGTGAATLRLNAEDDILVNANVAIQQSGGTPGTDKLNIVLNADSDASGAGRIFFSGTSGNTIALVTNGGNISLGGRDTTLAGAVGGATTYATSGTLSDPGVLLDYTTLNSGGGNIAIAGHGFAGGTSGFNRGIIVELGSDVNAAGGNVTMDGVGGTGQSDNYGVAIGGGPTNTVRTVGTGTIDITGTGGNGAQGFNEGFIMGSAVISAVNGAITITGTAGTSAISQVGYGIQLAANTDIVSTGNGAITLTGTGDDGGDGIAANSANGNFGPGGTVRIGQGSSGTYSGNISLNSLGGTGISLGGLGTTNVVTTGTVTANAAGAGVFTLASGSTISGTTSVSLTAGNITLAGTVTSSGEVTLTPSTNAATIGVNDASKNFSISDAEIDLITAPGVTIGSATNTGGITVGTDGAVTAGAKNLTLVTGTTIAVNGGVSTTGNVVLNGGTSISQTAAGVIAASGLAAKVTAGGADLTQATSSITTFAADASGSVGLLESNGFSIGSVGSVNGITAGTNVQLKAGGTISQTQAITAGGLAVTTTAGDISLDSVTNATAAVAFNATSGNVSYKTSTNLNVTTVGAVGTLASLVGATASGTLTLVTTGAATVIAQTAKISAATLDISTGSSGGVTLTNTSNLIGTVQSTAGIGTGGATIVDSAGGLNAGPITSTGDVSLVTTGDLTVLGATNVGTKTLALTTTGGAITQSSGVVSGAKFVANAATNVDFSTGGNTAGGSGFAATATAGYVAFLNNTAITIDSVNGTNGVTAAGPVFLGVSSGDITQTASGKITAGGLGLFVSAGSIVLDQSNDITGNVAVVSSPNASVTLRNAGNLNVGLVGPTTIYGGGSFSADGIAASTAAGKFVSLTSDTGTITQDAAAGSRILGNELRLHTTDHDVTLTNTSNQLTALGASSLGTGALNLLDAGGLTVTGAVVANGGVTLNTSGALTVSNTITSTGAVTLNASGTTTLGVALSGIGSLTTDAAGTTAINAAVTTTGAQTYHDAVTLGAAANLTGTAITFDSTVNNGGFGLTVTNSGAGLFSGAISGSGGFTQAGSGTTTLAAANTYGGATTINAGTLLVEGTIGNSATTVVGGTLGGNGSIGGTVTVQTGGHIAPGASAGDFAIGAFDLKSGSFFDVEIGGTAAGTQYDQLIVTGSVTLGGSLNTSLINAFTLTSTSTASFTIIDNDGSDAVVGQFAGLAENATFSLGSALYAVTYHGGDGNDVVLLAANDPPVLSGFGDVSAFTENGSSVRLDANQNATVSDPELNVSVNKFAGATLTLARNGGANPDDTFVGSGSLDLVDSNGLGENVSLDGGATFIGTFSQPGDGTFSITFNANAGAAEINSVMHQIFYANAGDNPPASAQIDVTFSDGNGQPGGQLQGGGAAPGTATGSFTVNITQINDAPFLLNVAPSASYVLGSSGSVLSPGLQAGDLDATPPSPNVGMAGATVKINSGFFAGDELFVNLPTSGGFFVVDEGDQNTGPVLVTTNISVQSNILGSLVLSGTDTPLHYQLVLDAVSYHSTAPDPSNGGANPHRTITWKVSDGLADNTSVNPPPLPETILSFNAPPTVDLDASGGGTGFTTTYTERDAPIPIVDTDILITDPDNAALNSAKIVLTNAKPGDVFSIAGALPFGIDSSINTSVPGQITINLNGSASLADYRTALSQIRFNNTSATPDETDRDITITVTDGSQGASNVAHATVHVVDLITTHDDFNADGVSDVLWGQDGGLVAEWLMTGGRIGDIKAVASLDADFHSQGNGGGTKWHFQDTGDFNADGRADVLWRHDNGQVVLWQLNGNQIVSNQSVATIGADWHNEGTGDFNGDGKADVLWRNDSGQVALWTMDGATIVGNQTVTTLGGGWHFQGNLDANGDGKSDVLLRNDSGQVVLWTMNGATIANNQSITNLGLDWNIVGTGDFGGDGKGDVLLRNDSGQVVLWQLNGNQIVSNQSIATPGNDWHVQDVGDYNSDGKSDVLWRNDSGQVVLWEMNGATITSNHTVTYQGGAAAPIANDWTVLSHHYDVL